MIKKIKNITIILLMFVISLFIFGNIINFSEQQKINSTSENVENVPKDFEQNAYYEISIPTTYFGTNYIEVEAVLCALYEENPVGDFFDGSKNTLRANIYYGEDTNEDNLFYQSNYVPFDFVNYNPGLDQEKFMVEWHFQISQANVLNDVVDDPDTEASNTTITDNVLLYYYDNITSADNTNYLAGTYEVLQEDPRLDEAYLNNTITEVPIETDEEGNSYRGLVGGKTYTLELENSDSKTYISIPKTFTLGESFQYNNGYYDTIDYAKFIHTSIDKGLYDKNDLDYRDFIYTVFFNLRTPKVFTRDFDVFLSDEFFSKNVPTKLTFKDSYKDISESNSTSIGEDGVLIDFSDGEKIYNFKKEEWKTINENRLSNYYNPYWNEYEAGSLDQLVDLPEGDTYSGSDGNNEFHVLDKNIWYLTTSNFETDYKLLKFKYANDFISSSARENANYYDRVCSVIYSVEDSSVKSNRLTNISVPYTPSFSEDNDGEFKYGIEDTIGNTHQIVDISGYIRLKSNQESDKNDINIENNIDDSDEFIDIVSKNWLTLWRDPQNTTEEDWEKIEWNDNWVEGQTFYSFSWSFSPTNSDITAPENHEFVEFNFKICQNINTRYNYKVTLFDPDYISELKNSKIQDPINSINGDEPSLYNPSTLTNGNVITTYSYNDWADNEITIENTDIFDGDYVESNQYDVEFYIDAYSYNNYYFEKHSPENIHMYLVNNETNDYVDLKDSGQLEFINSETIEESATDDWGNNYDIVRDHFKISGIDAGNSYTLRAESEHNNIFSEVTQGYDNSVKIASFDYSRKSELIPHSLEFDGSNRTYESGWFKFQHNDYYEDISEEDFEIIVKNITNSSEEDYVVPTSDINISGEPDEDEQVRVDFKIGDENNQILEPDTVYEVTVTLKNNEDGRSSLSNKFKTGDWTPANKPTITKFEFTDYTASTATFNYKVEDGSISDDPLQGNAEITNIALVVEEDVYVNLGTEMFDDDILIEDLEPGVNYKFQLRVEYLDTGPNETNYVYSDVVEITTLAENPVHPPVVTVNLEENDYESATISFIIETYEGDEYTPATVLESVDLFIDGNKIPEGYQGNGNIYYELDNYSQTESTTKGNMLIKNLSSGKQYTYYLSYSWNNGENAKTDEDIIDTMKYDQAIAPRIEESECKIEFSADSETWLYYYTINNKPPNTATATATVQKIKITDKSNPDIIYGEDSINSSEESIEGTLQLQHIEFDKTYDFVIELTWIDLKNEVQDSIDYEIIEESSDFQYLEIEENYIEVDPDWTTQTTAKISYSFSEPKDANFWEATPEIEQVTLEVFDEDSKEVFKDTNNSTSASFILEDLDSETTYTSSLQVEVKYKNPLDSTEILKNETIEYEVDDFTTLINAPILDDQINLLEYNSSENKILIEFKVIDSNELFNDDDFEFLKVRANVDGKLTNLNISNIKKDLDSWPPEIPGNNIYTMEILDIEPGKIYSDWQISIVDSDEPDWIFVNLYEDGEQKSNIEFEKSNFLRMLILVILVSLIVLIIIIILIVITVKIKSRKKYAF